MGPRNNAIFVLQPYWAAGTWVFDDPTTNLIAEPFVLGMDRIITKWVLRSGIDLEKAKKGFRLLFAVNDFPGAAPVERRESELGGTWYEDPSDGQRGWLCPALFLYFREPPVTIYGKPEPWRTDDSGLGGHGTATI